MAAALAKRQHSPYDGLHHTNLARDLYQIAELIELCFANRLDSNGRAAVREMKTISRMGPLLYLLSFLGLTQDLGMGYVWRVHRRVVGNASLYRAGVHPYLGQGWMIANVAVHPDYRRQGIAQALMKETLNLAHRRSGKWVILQVENDNSGAIQLYERLGFKRFETLVQWESPGLPGMLPALSKNDHLWEVRRHRSADTPEEMKLILGRARLGAMTWARPIDRSHFQEGLFDDLNIVLEGLSREKWVLPDPVYPERLLGVTWLTLTGWRRARISLFLDPGLEDRTARQMLILTALQQSVLSGRQIYVETTAGDEAVEAFLQAAGFRVKRRLMQMRLQFNAAAVY